MSIRGYSRFDYLKACDKVADTLYNNYLTPIYGRDERYADTVGTWTEEALHNIMVACMRDCNVTTRMIYEVIRDVLMPCLPSEVGNITAFIADAYRDAVVKRDWNNALNDPFIVSVMHTDALDAVDLLDLLRLHREGKHRASIEFTLCYMGYEYEARLMHKGEYDVIERHIY